MVATREINVVISGKYTGASAFARARSDMDASLAQAREAGKRLNPFGRLLANAERQDAARETTTQAQSQASAARQRAAAMAQSDLARELADARAAATTQHIRQEQAAVLAAATQQRAAAVKTAADRREISARLYAATHTQRETDLKNLRRYYAQQRLDHRGNAQMLAAIDRAYGAQRNAMLASGGGGWRGMLRQGSPLRHGAMMLASQASFSASPYLGMAHSAMSGGGGGAAGGLAASLGVAALPLGAAAAAAAVLVVGFKACYDAVKGANAAIKGWARIMDESVLSLKSARRAIAGPGQDKGDEDTQGMIDNLRKERKAAHKAINQEYEDNKTWLNRDIMKEQKRTQQDASDAHYNKQIRAAKELAARQREAKEALTPARAADAVEQARIAAMADGPAKARAAMEQRQAQEKYEAQWGNYVRPGSVDEKVLGEVHAQQRIAQERQEQEEIRRGRLEAQEANINATQEGFARDVSLLRLKHASEIQEYDRAGRDKTSLLERQASERVALAKEEAKRQQAADHELRQSTIAATLRGREAEKAAMEENQRRRLEEAKGPQEKADANRLAAQENARFAREQADSEEEMAAGAIEARLGLIKNSVQREQAMLALKHQREQQAARGQSQVYQEMLKAKQAAERESLQYSQQQSPLQLADRGFGMLRPSQVSAESEVDKQHRENLKALQDNAELSRESIAVLREILSKLGVEPQVASFN